MRDVSKRFRLISMEGDLDVTTAVGKEMSNAYWQVAEWTCPLGTPKKTMDSIVANAVDIQVWRARAMRLGEAGCFSAAAYRRVQDAVRSMAERRAKAVAANALARARQSRAELEAARNEYRSQLAIVERMLARADAADVSVEELDCP